MEGFFIKGVCDDKHHKKNLKIRQSGREKTLFYATEYLNQIKKCVKSIECARMGYPTLFNKFPPLSFSYCYKNVASTVLFTCFSSACYNDTKEAKGRREGLPSTSTR